jgi:5-formyltetrahydrofolate cyclo-ligase
VIREATLEARSALPAAERSRLDAAIVAAACDLARALRCVAAYAPLPDEPGGSGLPERLAAVLPPDGLLLPALLPDRDLDWVTYAGTLREGGTMRVLREPPGRRLGVAAIARAEIVFVPALAADPTGARLGRGGGSYDRALPRVRAGVPIIALLYPGEILPVIPTQPHDRPVTAALTPDGVTAFGGSG